MRSLAAAALAAVSLSCADQSVGIQRGVRVASLPIAPLFVTSPPAGGPRIDIETIRGVLRRANSTDSNVAEAPVEGDSAILEFEDVAVTGEETTYNLSVQAFDENGVVVFEGSLQVTVTPGANAPASPELTYTAPDKNVAQIFINAGGESVSTVELQWAGATPGNTSCLNRVPDASANTQEQLSIAGITQSEQPVSNVRVGWTSRDPSVATVDENGFVVALCSNRFTYVVARTFLDVVDSVKVNVTAPPFTLLMSPETANVSRGSQLQMTALLVDENNNATAASAVTWNSSDTERATVSSTGLVSGISNGRVVITASAGDRTTVGIIEVVRPAANRVEISPTSDVINQGQRRIFGASAFESNNERILDASGFTWTSSNTNILTVNSSGSVLGVSAGTANVTVSLDGKSASASVEVIASTTGQVAGRVQDASNDAALQTASVATATGTVTTGSDGRFTSPELQPSQSTLTVSRTGYVSFDYFNLPVQLGQTIELGDLPMAPTGAAGTLTGTVVNALNDVGVSGATVKLFGGITSNGSNPNCTTSCDALVAQTTTATNGTFTLAGVPAGTYTYSVTASGYTFNRKVAVAVGGQTRDARIPLSPALSGTDIRIVLSWGNCSDPDVPCDLDSHLTGPKSAPDTGRFHVAWFDTTYVSGPDFVGILDNDAFNGLGPETITLKQKAAGVYKYYVHNFSDAFDTTNTRLSGTSQAKVEVYQGANLIATFFPPAGQPGTVWAVFHVEGTSITQVNQMLKIQDFTEVPADFMRIGASDDPELGRLINDLKRNQKKRR